MKRVMVLAVFAVLVVSLFGVNRIVEITVEGNVKTLASTVRNLSGVKIGDEFDIEKIYRAKRTLQDSGLFTDVYMQIKPVENDYRLVITVEETNTIYPYLGQYLTIGVGERNLLRTGVNIYGGLRFLRFTDKKFLGFIPQPQLFWGGFTIGAGYAQALGTGIDFITELTLFKEVPWQTDLLLTLNRFKLGASYPFGDYVAGVSYTFENATFDASPANDYSISIISGALAFGDVENYRQERANLYGHTVLSYGFGKGYSYLQQTAELNFWYRIIGRIYILSTTRVGVTYLGTAPVTKQFYIGGSTDLKGWNAYSFNPGHFVFEAVEAGVPLTESFGIAPSDELSAYIPKLYLMGVAGTDKTLGLSIGIGFEWRTPLGIAFEPQIFFGGDGFKFYFELR